MTLASVSTLGEIGLEPGDWIYADFGNDPDYPPQYMKVTEYTDAGWINADVYTVNPNNDTASFTYGKAFKQSDSSPSSVNIYVSKAPPPAAAAPAYTAKPGLPQLPTEDETLAWGGPVTKNGYIPSVGMHVSGKGPMHGKIISLSKNKQSVVVLTSTGEKSTRQVSALRLDTEEYNPFQTAFAPGVVPQGMALAVDTPAEALGKTLQDGKWRALVTSSPGLRNGEMVTVRAIGPSGKKYNRVIFALTKEQRATLATNLATGAMDEQGDWVHTKKPTGDIAVGERVAIRPTASSKPENQGTWRPDNSGNPPNYEVVSVQDEPDGGKTVTFKSLTSAETVTTPWAPGHTYTTTTWDPTKIKVLQPGQFSLSQTAQNKGWTIVKDGGLSAMHADGRLDVEPGQTVPQHKSAFSDFGSSTNVRMVASNGIVIEVVEPAGQYTNDSRYGMSSIYLPEGATDADLSGALAELGLGGYSPMTQSSAKQQVRVLLSTMVQWDQTNAENTQGLSDAQMFQMAGDQMGIPDLGWQDVRVGVDESIGKVSFFWSDRAIAAMKAKSKMNLVVKGSKSSTADVIVSAALYGQVNSMNKRLNGAVYAPSGKGLGASAGSDASKYAGHGSYVSSKSYNFLPDHNDQAGYISGGIMSYYRPEAVYGRIGDMRASLGDSFGNPNYGEENVFKNILNWGNVKDYYVSGGLSPEQTAMIAAPSQYEVDSAIAKLKAKGIVSINGVPIEKYIVTMAQAKKMKPSDLPPLYLPPNIRNILDLPESYEV
jgi:hypothetical protein